MATLVVGAAAAACSHGALGGASQPATASRAPRGAASARSDGGARAGAAEAQAASIRRFDAARDGAAVLLAERDGRIVAYVADEDDARVRLVDVDDGREIASIDPHGVPAELAMLPDGRVLASLRDVSEVAVLEGERVVRRVAVPTEPIGLALSPDDATLVVTSGWGHAVTILDAHTFETRASYAVGREPRAVVVAKDGSRAFVSHAVGQSIDVVPLRGLGPPRAISVSGVEIVVSWHAMASEIDRSACQGFALARSASGRIFAPQVLVFSGDPATTSSGYGGGVESAPEVFHVPIVDEDAASLVAESRRMRSLTRAHADCRLPRAAAHGKAGLFVTCLGDDVVTLVDGEMLHPADVEIARWKVPAGPVGIALDEARSRAVVWSQLAHALTTIAVGEGDAVPRPFALSSVTLPRAVRTSARVERGRALFHATHDKRISADGRACASCHPDGRDDTLVWSSPNGPRQTPMLAGRLGGAAPYGWNGDAKDLSTHLESTFKRLGGSGLAGEDKEALMAYVATLRPPPPPPKPRDAAAVARGAQIFRSAETGCSGCHGESGDLPDGASHDVKSIAEGDTRRKFDTPSLRFVGGSAPYFHDGRHPDLVTLIERSDGKMGHTKHLTRRDVVDLAAYLESL